MSTFGGVAVSMPSVSLGGTGTGADGDGSDANSDDDEEVRREVFLGFHTVLRTETKEAEDTDE